MGDGKMGRIEKKSEWTNILRDKAFWVEVPLETLYHTG